MFIMIIGAGFTGVQLAKRLISENNEVTLIDNNEDIVSNLSNRLDCNVVHDNGNNIEVLERENIQNCDALVTLTDSDEVNMIICSLVDALYPSILKIARVRNYAYYSNTNNATKQHAETFAKNHRPLFGIDHMIHPDVVAADAIVKAVNHGAISDIISFGEKEKYELTSLPVEKGSTLDGIALKDIRSKIDKKFIIAYHEKKAEDSDNTETFLPSGESIIRAGDRIGIIASRNDITSLFELCGTKIDHIKKIGLVGIGRIGTIVADRIFEKEETSLLRKFFSATQRKTQSFSIIDTDKELCEAASKRYPGAKVYNTDVTDEHFIKEEGIDKYNLIICATHNHELNMVVSAYLESLGVEKTISLVAHSKFGNIARKLGVDVAIPLRDSLVDSIISHLHGKSVTGIHTVSNGEFEIVECDLSSSSKFVGKQLKDIAKPGEYLVLLIKKNGSENYELPQGNTLLTVGDHLVIIEKTGDKKVLEKFSK